MGRIPSFRRLRARSAEEQMLATMLVAGLVFAVVSLVAFLRPGGSSQSARGSQPTAAVNTNVNDGGTGSIRTRTTHTSTLSGAIEGGAVAAPTDLTQRLQGLFASVLSPLGFTTNLPRLDPLPPGSVPIQPASAGGGSSPGFPTSFPPLPGHLPPPVSLPPVTDTLPPTTDTLPPPTTVPPTTVPPTTVPPTTVPPTTATTAPPTTIPTTDTTLPPTTATTAPPTTDTSAPATTATSAPPTTDTSAPATTDTSAPATSLPLPIL